MDLNHDIQNLQKWFSENKLNINEEKSEYMTIANNQIKHRFQGIKIKVGNKLLTNKNNIKILGVILSSDLSWESHTHTVINSLRHRYRSFNRSSKLLTIDSRKLLYNATIASRLNYCDIIWDNCNINNSNKLQTIQNRCVRTILNTAPGVSSGPLFEELTWLRLKDKRKLHKCVLFHELLLGRGPAELCEELEQWKNRGTHVTRGTANGNLSLPSHRTNYISKSFYYETAKFWNTLPLNIRAIKNRTSFKERLHNFMVKNPQ